MTTYEPYEDKGDGWWVWHNKNEIGEGVYHGFPKAGLPSVLFDNLCGPGYRLCENPHFIEYPTREQALAGLECAVIEARGGPLSEVPYEPFKIGENYKLYPPSAWKWARRERIERAILPDEVYSKLDAFVQLGGVDAWRGLLWYEFPTETDARTALEYALGRAGLQNHPRPPVPAPEPKYAPLNANAHGKNWFWSTTRILGRSGSYVLPQELFDALGAGDTVLGVARGYYELRDATDDLAGARALLARPEPEPGPAEETVPKKDYDAYVAEYRKLYESYRRLRALVVKVSQDLTAGLKDVEKAGAD